MVAILLGKGFEEAEAVVPADLLRRAGVEVRLVGVGGRQITGSHGITITADLTLEELDRDQVELLMLPGGMGGVETLSGDVRAQALIQHCYNEGRWLAAICAAPTILANLGMLDRRRAACHPCVWDEMGSPAVDREAQVVVDGRIVTAQAAGAAYPFGLKLVEVLKGPEEAQKIADAILYRG